MKKGNKKRLTIFVDESIHNIKFNGLQETRKCGTYSFVICNGEFTDSKNINEKHVIKTQVSLSEEKKHTEVLTIEGINAALTWVYLNMNYNGDILICIDNNSIYKTDKRIHKKLLEQFSNVTIKHIPRKKNTAADKLCHENILISMPLGQCMKIANCL